MSEGANKTGWLVVVGSTIALTVSNGPILLFTFGVLLKPVSEQFGWPRGTMSGQIYGLIFAAFTVGSGIGPLIMGLSFDATGRYSAALIGL